MWKFFQVHEYYENWLLNGLPSPSPAPVMVINADEDLEVIMKTFEDKKSIILGKETYVKNAPNSSQ